MASELSRNDTPPPVLPVFPLNVLLVRVPPPTEAPPPWPLAEFPLKMLLVRVPAPIEVPPPLPLADD